MKRSKLALRGDGHVGAGRRRQRAPLRPRRPLRPITKDTPSSPAAASPPSSKQVGDQWLGALRQQRGLQVGEPLHEVCEEEHEQREAEERQPRGPPLERRRRQLSELDRIVAWRRGEVWQGCGEA